MTARTGTAATYRHELALGGGGIIAVHDTDADLARLNLSALTDVPNRVVAFQVRPACRRASWLAADLHSAIGVNQTMTGFGRPGEGDWALTAAALHVDKIEHVAVLDPWLLTPTLLEELIEYLQSANVVLWLVGRGSFTDSQREVVHGWVENLTDAKDFLEAWSDRTHLIHELAPSATTDAPVAEELELGEGDDWRRDGRWPMDVPDVDFPLFRAFCRDQLSADQFAMVDEHLRANYRQAQYWFAKHLTDDTTQNEERLARHLHELWEDAPLLSHYIVTIRAHQIAAFTLNWQLQVNLPQLIGTASTQPRRAARTRAQWDRLRGYSAPYRGAICALTASGVDVADQPRITVDAVRDQGRILAGPDGGHLPIEEGAEQYLHAQATVRRLHGAPAHASLLAGADDKPLTERAISTVLTRARLETGLNVTAPRIERRYPTGDRWTTRWGLSIQELR